MHRFTDPYTISYTTTSQSFVYQVFSYHLPITQTSYTLLQTYTFVQHSTQPCNRYSYALNNPLRYKDPGGEFVGIDDILVFGVGFVLGTTAYIVTHDINQFSWGDVGKAVLTGLVVGTIAEAGYLTLGGGLAAASTLNATTVGGLGSTSSAVGFSGIFSFSFGSNIIEHKEQIKDAYQNKNEWSGLGLIAAYAGVASITAGLQVNEALNKATWLGNNINVANVFSNTAEKGLSTLVEKSYDTDTHQWGLNGKDWKNIGLELSAGFLSSYTGELGIKIIAKNQFLKNNPFMEKPIYNTIKNLSKDIFYLSTNKSNVWHNQEAKEEVFYDLYFGTFKEFWRSLFLYFK